MAQVHLVVATGLGEKGLWQSVGWAQDFSGRKKQDIKTLGDCMVQGPH